MPKAYTDVTDLRSGMVTVLEKTEQKRRGAALWRCRCDCGKEFLTEGYKISGGKIRSCGCLRNAHQFKDLTAQRFGRLTAIARLDEKKGKDIPMYGGEGGFCISSTIHSHFPM